MTREVDQGLKLDSYLRHTVDGTSLQDIADALGVGHRSTILRRVRRAEDLRDSPEWDELIQLLEKDRPRHGFADGYAMTEETICRALRLNMPDVLEALGSTRRIVGGRSSYLITHQGHDNVAMVAHEQTVTWAKLTRRTLLAFLAFGWVICDRESKGKVQSYRLTRAAHKEVLT